MNINRKNPGQALGQTDDKGRAPVFVKYGLIAIAAIVVIVAAVLIYFSVTGSYVAKVDDKKIGKGEFSYYLYVQKSTMLNEAMSVDATTDEATFWDTEIDGKSAITVAKEKTLESLREVKIQLIKAEEAGISLNDEELASIDDWVTTNIIDAEDVGNGNRSKANKVLTESYGITVDELEQLNKDITIVSKFQNKHVEDTVVAEADIAQYYEKFKDKYLEGDMRTAGEEAVWARHILITAAKDTAKPEEIATAKTQAEVILAKVKAGDDFSTLAAENSADGNAAEGGGYVFGRNAMVTEFTEAAFTIEPGQENAVIVQTDYGFHIIMVEEKYAEGEPVSLRCATEYPGYGVLFAKALIFEDQVNEWKKDTKFNLVMNKSLYDSIV